MFRLRYEFTSDESLIKAVVAAAEAGDAKRIKGILKHDSSYFVFEEALGNALLNDNRKAWSALIDYAATHLGKTQKAREYYYQRYFITGVGSNSSPEKIDTILETAKRHHLNVTLDLDRELAIILPHAEKNLKLTRTIEVLVKHGAGMDKALAMLEARVTEKEVEQGEIYERRLREIQEAVVDITQARETAIANARDSLETSKKVAAALKKTAV